MELTGKTDIGKLRDTNQDTFATGTLDENFGFLLVCDGMGGQQGGNVASQMSRDAIATLLSNNLKKEMNEEEIKEAISGAVFEANKLVYERSLQDESLLGMGTTVVLAVLQEKTAYIAHAGDSRAYLLSKGDFTQLTKDHSFVEMLIDEGEITRSQAQDHPRKNQITRAVGVLPNVEIDFKRLELKEGDRILLCSDGLTNTCKSKEMSCILQMSSLKKAAQTLIEIANAHGGEDNITVALAQV